MRTILALPAILAALPVLVTALLETGQECKKNKVAIHELVMKFCANTTIHVPSDYANTGFVDGYNIIGINGTCKPAELVPPEYCYVQFFQMCVDSVDNWNYGTNNCQTWTLMKLRGSGSILGGVGFGGTEGVTAPGSDTKIPSLD